MSSSRSWKRAAGAFVFLLAATASGPSAGNAQVPFTAVGLGYPVPPLGARSAALGGVPTGIPGGSLSFGNPADLADVSHLRLGFTAYPEEARVAASRGEDQRTGRNRFSVLRAVVPAGKWRLSAGFASVLDQDWRVTIRDTLRTSSGDFAFTERRESDGGLSGGDLALAREVGPVSFGVGVQRLTGSVRRSFRRTFQRDTAAGAGDPPAESKATGGWSYSGWRLRSGVRLSVARRLRLGASAQWAGGLTATPAEEGDTARFELPGAVSAGASYRVGGSSFLVLGAGWDGWSETAPSLADAEAEDARWAGGGVEIGGLEVGPVRVPLRVGARARELPFSPPGKGQATERALTVGVGAIGAGGRAVVDAALEFGKRGELQETGAAEDFTRFALSLSFHP